MTHQIKAKIRIWPFISLLFCIALLVSCGGGGGGGGSAAAPAASPGTPATAGPAFTVSTVDTGGDVGWYTRLQSSVDIPNCCCL